MGDLLNGGSPKNTLCSLPPEMIWRIFTHSDLLTLMCLSSSCRRLRQQVHVYFDFRIVEQAKKYPEVKMSLEKIGWKKKQEYRDCNCFRIMGGPLFTWSKLAEDWNFCPSNISRTSTTVGDKTFFTTFDNTICYRKITEGVGHNYLQTLGDPSNDGLPYYLSSDLASYDNVLAFSVKKYIQRHAVISINIYNASTLVKVREVNVCEEEFQWRVYNAAIELTRNTMVVCLGGFIQHQLDRRESKIQIWELNTNDPQVEGIVFLYTLSHDTAQLTKNFLFFQAKKRFCVNDQFVVVFDHVIKVFRKIKDNPLVLRIHIDNEALSNISIQSGQGDHLAVAVMRIEANNHSHITVSVCSIKRGEWIAQKDINVRQNWPSSFYMKWFGDHLIIGFQQDSKFIFFSWQPGLTYFLSSPCHVPALRRSPRGNDERKYTVFANCIHLDFQGLTTAVYNRHRGIVHFKDWKSSL